MQKILLLLSFVALFAFNIQAQAPQAFQYQAVARGSNGLPLINQNVRLRVSIISGSPTGSILYVETHAPTTNQFGLFTLPVGQGTVANGTFSTINWGTNSHYIKVEMDETGGFAYQDMGIVQLLSVPYALHAGSAGNTNDPDPDPTNELQTLSIVGQDLTISGGNTVTLPNGSTVQVLSKVSNTISLSGGGGSVTLNDDDAANEIQSLSLVGTTLSISGGNNVTLPSGGGTLDAAYDFGGAGLGRNITADAGEVSITANTANSNALRTTNSSTGTGIVATNTNTANTFSPIQANTNSSSASVAGVIGNSTGTAWGVAGQVQSTAPAQAAVYGSNLRTNGGHGVFGIGFNGVVGQTGQSQGFAVYGENFDNIAPLGDGVGVAGRGYKGVFGEDRYAGGQAGAYGVFSNGSFGASGTKSFHIDHPTDPENKYLRHFSIESDEVLNVYRGTVVFDANGQAVVTLPDYFHDINKNISYQLTPVGAYMPLFVLEKVNENNQFVVAGGIAGKEVSWAVYAERNDLYLQKNPEQRTTELEKRPHEKGNYLMPSLYGAGEDKAIFKKPAKIEQVPMSVAE